MDCRIRFVGFVAAGYIHGGGGLEQGPVRETWIEAWGDAQKLEADHPYGDKVAGVEPRLPPESTTIAADRLNVGVRTANLIRKMFGGRELSGITLQELLLKGEDEWLKEPQFGRKCLNEMKDALRQL